MIVLCLITLNSVAESPLLWQGEPLGKYIQHLLQQDLAIIYSSDLVSDDYLVLQEPMSADPVDALRQALRPHGLKLVDGASGSLLVVRDSESSSGLPGPKGSGSAKSQRVKTAALPEIVVTSSAYSIRHQQAGSHTFLDRELTTKLPDLGDEIVRSIDRLPGVANGGLSTRSHIRGGASNEQLLLFDGVRLYEPFHLKDFHSISTIIDQNAVAGIDFYSAGYQARYGDRMSGVTDISLREPRAEMETELGFSFFNTSLLSLGRFGNNSRGDWLISARRANLDIIADILNSDYGSPRYEDVLAHIGWQLSDRTDVSFSTLFSYDRVLLTQPDGTEDADAKYRNRVAWLKTETEWSSIVSSSTVLSVNQISNSRDGRTDNPGIMQGQVTDRRDFRSIGLKQDWQFNAGDSWLFTTGFEVQRLEAEYEYDSTLIIFPPFDEILDNVPLLERSFRTNHRGSQYSAYLESRWKIVDGLILDLGFRWDQQTYTNPSTATQTSPRFNLLYELTDRTELRLGFGYYYQAQEINELQIGDGQTTFFPAQRAKHFVASLAHHYRGGADLRIEIYRKKYSLLTPRYENVFDPLVLIPELQIDRVRIDADSAIAKGAEIMLTAGDDESGLLWWGSYTWAVIEDDIAGQRVKRSWDQIHTVKAGVNWDWKHWSFSAAGSVHTGWPRTDLITETIVNPDGSTELVATTSPRNYKRHSVFHSLDARASRRFSLRKGELTTFIEITNIYDRQNPCCAQYSLVSDSNGNDVVKQKQSYWLPLIPSLGVTWRF